MTDRHGLEIGLVVVIAVAAVGLVSGVESSGRSVASYVEDRPARATAVVARSYRDMQVHATGPNAALPDVWWQSISTPADLFVAARSGESSAVARCNQTRCYNWAQNANAKSSDSAVAVRPMRRLNPTDCHTPGCSNSACQGASDRVCPPMAGR